MLISTVYIGYFRYTLVDLDLDDMWFQQNDFTCHTIRELFNLLKPKFGEHNVSQ